MSAPQTTQRRLPLLLFWAGVALAPLAALLLWLGSGGGPLKAAAVLAIGAAVLIGLSVVLRRDGETVRIELQETMVTELAAVRAEVAHQVAAAGNTDALRHEVGVLAGEVDALRQELVAVQDTQAAAAQAAQAPAEPQPARVVADREPEVRLRTEPVAEKALRDGRLVSAVAGAETPSRHERPNVYRTETVQVTTHTTRVSEVAEPALVGAPAGGNTYGSRPNYGGTSYGSPAGLPADLSAGGGNDRVDRWAERLGARAERFGSTGERLAERLSGARAMRRDRDEDPLADLRASADSDDLAGPPEDDPWTGLRPDDTDPRHATRPGRHGTHDDDPYDPPAPTEYGTPTPNGYADPDVARAGRNGYDDPGLARGGRGGGYGGAEVPRVRAGRRRAELRVTDEWAEVEAPVRSGGRHGTAEPADDVWEGSATDWDRSRAGGQPPLAITQGDDQPRWSQYQDGAQPAGHRYADADQPVGRQYGGAQPAAREYGGGQPGGRQYQGGAGYQGGGSHAAPVGPVSPVSPVSAAPVSPAGRAESRYGRDSSDTHRVAVGGEYGSRHGRRDGSYADETTGSWVDEEESTGGWRSDGRHGAGGPQAGGGQYRSAAPTGRHQGVGYQSGGGAHHGGGDYQSGEYQSGGSRGGDYQSGDYQSGGGRGGQHQGGDYRGGQQGGQYQGSRYRGDGPAFDGFDVPERPSRHGRQDGGGRW